MYHRGENKIVILRPLDDGDGFGLRIGGYVVVFFNRQIDQLVFALLSSVSIRNHNVRHEGKVSI